MSERLNKLIGELEGMHAQAQKVLTDHKDGLTPEARTTLDKLSTDMAEKRTAIETLRADEAREADIKTVNDFLNMPQHKVTHGTQNAHPEEGGGDDFRTQLQKTGWSFGEGMVYKTTSLNEKVAMYPEEVLFGDIPDNDQKVAEFFVKTRVGFQPGYREAFAKYLRFTCKTRNEVMAFSMLEPEERKALTEGQDTAGGFLVPPDIQAEMLVRLPQTAIMRRYARVQTTSRDTLRWPMVQPASATAGGVASGGGSIFSSGFIGSWVGETPAFTDTDPAFGLFDVPIKKVRAVTKLSNDFVNDAATNVLAWLATNGAENMGLVEDSGFFTGLGTALIPKGIMNSGALTVDVEGSTANTISNTTAAPGSAPKIIDVCYAVPSQYLTRARWIMRRSIEGKIRKLVDGSGRFHWPGVLQSGFAAVQRDLMGYPVDNTEFMADDGTDANKVVLFGDLSSYVIGQRAQITTVILRERFADTDQVGIVLFERVGGDTWNPDALRIGVV